jgi:helix-turn-helix protein
MAEAKEGLWMTAKERDRLKVLHEVQKRHITQKQAAAELGLSVRWVQTLLVRLRGGGDSALRHGLRSTIESKDSGRSEVASRGAVPREKASQAMA